MRKKKLYNDVIRIICSFLPVYKLRDWIELYMKINGKKINWEYLPPSLGLNSCLSQDFQQLIKEEIKNSNCYSLVWYYISLWDDLNYLVEEELKKNPNSKNIDWVCLSSSNNPKAISILENNLDKLDEDCWIILCENPSAVHLIEKELNRNPNSEYINWNRLCNNPKALHLIEEEYKKNPNSERINWWSLCNNSYTIHLIEEELKRNPDSEKIDWIKLCDNSCAVHLIEEELRRNPNSEKINWWCLCLNPDYTHIIEEEYEKNPDSKRINWWQLCKNHSAEAVHLIEKELERNPEKINLYDLIENPKSVHLIKKYSNILDNHSWSVLSAFPYHLYLLEEEYDRNPDSKKINWLHLCHNSDPIALRIIKKELERNPNSEKIIWISLCDNENPDVMCLIEEELERNPDSKKIIWRSLCENPKAIQIIKKYINNPNINWEYLSANPAIFETAYNYELNEILMQL